MHDYYYRKHPNIRPCFNKRPPPSSSELIVHRKIPFKRPPPLDNVQAIQLHIAMMVSVTKTCKTPSSVEINGDDKVRFNRQRQCF